MIISHVNFHIFYHNPKCACLCSQVTASLSEEAINSCAAERMEKIQKKLAKKFRKCAGNYSEEELNQLEEMGQKIQAYKCFKVWHVLV